MKSDSNLPSERKLRIAYLTSCREVGLAGHELIGRNVYDPDSKKKLGYRKGTLESLVSKLKQDSLFGSMFELGLVIYDDTRDEYQREWTNHKLWPTEMKTAEGKTLRELSRQVPSSWRSLKDTVKKASQKKKYEARIVRLLSDNSIDIIIVDSYRCIIGKTLLEPYKYKIINIHPGILKHESADTPGAFPTRDSITRAKYGYVITDDKKVSGKVSGKVISVVYKGAERKAVKVAKVSLSGVTIHVVNEKIDAGPIILQRIYRYNAESITEEKLRQRNYRIKNDLLPEALIKYVNSNKKLFDIS